MTQTSETFNKELIDLLSRAAAFEEKQYKIAREEFSKFRRDDPKRINRTGMGNEERRAMRYYTYHGNRIGLFKTAKEDLIKKIESLEKMVREYK
jgi:hypothetical protein